MHDCGHVALLIQGGTGITSRVQCCLLRLDLINSALNMPLARPIIDLINELAKLPAVGPKSAQRLTYHLLRAPRAEAARLAQAILDVKDKTVTCEHCFNIAESSPCEICTDPKRTKTRVFVVEEPLDVVALERTDSVDGVYHVLGSSLSPLNNIGPDEIRIKELEQRVKTENLQEIVVATNPTMEGEATALYLAKLIKPYGVKITRIARGLPVGGDLEYADQVTLSRALEGRSEL
jgi:recombination protein RecR